MLVMLNACFAVLIPNILPETPLSFQTKGTVGLVSP